MDFKNLHESKNFKRIVLGICAFILLLFVFQAGIFVGYRKASFSFRLGDSYYRSLDGGRRGFITGFGNKDLPGGHGAVGKIVRVSLPTFVVAGPDNIEKIVHIQNTTDIRHFRAQASSTDLKVNDFVVVLGSPDENAQIQATFIRILPPPSK